MSNVPQQDIWGEQIDPWVECKNRVDRPGSALMIVGILAIIANILYALVSFALHDFRPPPRPMGMSDEEYQSYQLGREAAPAFDCCLLTIPTVMIYPMVIAAGYRMRSLRSRWLAIMGSVLAMVPCSCMMLIGVPIGIWCLIVLNDSKIQAAFASETNRR